MSDSHGVAQLEGGQWPAIQMREAMKALWRGSTLRSFHLKALRETWGCPGACHIKVLTYELNGWLTMSLGKAVLPVLGGTFQPLCSSLENKRRE